MASWITVEEVTDALGAVPATDTAHLTRCTDAANAFAYRRRAAAGYLDDPDISPGPDATLGTVTYAVALYRERGTVDSFASFEAFNAGAIPPSTYGQVLRLLGINRPAIDLPDVDAVTVTARHRWRLAGTRMFGGRW